MSNIEKSEFGRKEDHLVKATLIVDGVEINGVPCKVYLPERIEEKPYLIFKPSKDDTNKIMASHMGSLQASVLGFNKEKELTIESPEVYFLEASTKYWDHDISDVSIPAEPQDFHVIRHITSDDSPEKTQIVVWISANPFLAPFIQQTSSFTGDLELERVKNIEFTFKGIRILFDKHFRSKKAENGDFIQWSFLVACTEIDFPADNAEIIKSSLLPDLDDFLLIASFAARQRTACLGWTASDKQSYTTFYRGNYVYPEANDNLGINDGLIDISDFEKFMQTCYQSFSRYENKLAMRNALYSIIPSQPIILETSFLNMFAGLETLILDFRRLKSLEFVLDENDWTSFKIYLKKCIKKSTSPQLESQQRASIYSKLEELNRVSLREAFELFCNNYSINLLDLWPVFGEKGGKVGLAEIRNRIIHGDPFCHDMIDPLIAAKKHLEYVLERVLSRVLQWQIEDTKVSPGYLRSHTVVIKDMPIYREKLSKYINDSVSTEP